MLQQAEISKPGYSKALQEFIKPITGSEDDIIGPKKKRSAVKHKSHVGYKNNLCQQYRDQRNFSTFRPP
ncbi:MAG TPA: hypothetical protein PKY86_08320 [Niabella sp.]|nr:hypothetical protein [Niabella sp.]HQX21419.1 hypothetical protein [Niabella sp.]HRB36139.1 hypothetical protein [Niabella sp.]HRB80197.1 hypothetical protein [Niabella sp.]